jgi:hypothetical protein
MAILMCQYTGCQEPATASYDGRLMCNTHMHLMAVRKTCQEQHDVLTELLPHVSHEMQIVIKRVLLRAEDVLESTDG